jgi:hypothetical protein
MTKCTLLDWWKNGKTCPQVSSADLK